MPRPVPAVRNVLCVLLKPICQQRKAPTCLLTGLGQPRILPWMSAARPQIKGPVSSLGPPCPPRLRRSRSLLFPALLAVTFLVSSCATPTRTTAPPTPPAPAGVTHIVQPGQNLFRIGLAYGVPVATLIEVNRLKPSAPLQVGQRLFIPGA
ncbi:MAG: LysM peptidoglycan-binding domain-containing protein, partial [Zetaproteobacteria bacterium]